MYRFAIVVGLLLALGALTAQAQWRWMRDSAASEFTDADWDFTNTWQIVSGEAFGNVDGIA